MSLRAARRLRAHGIDARVLNLRWLNPLPREDILREARATGTVLVVDETRHTGALSDAIISLRVDAQLDVRMARVTSRDSFVPLGPAADRVLLGESDIETAAVKLCRV